MLPRILVVTFGALCLVLSGCIECEEEIWLNPDGSGRIEARYKMPSAVAKRIGEPDELVRVLQEAAERDPHVEITSLTHTAEGGGVTVGSLFSTPGRLRVFSLESADSEESVIG